MGAVIKVEDCRGKRNSDGLVSKSTRSIVPHGGLRV